MWCRPDRRTIVYRLQLALIVAAVLVVVGIGVAASAVASFRAGMVWPGTSPPIREGLTFAMGLTVTLIIFSGAVTLTTLAALCIFGQRRYTIRWLLALTAACALLFALWSPAIKPALKSLGIEVQQGLVTIDLGGSTPYVSARQVVRRPVAVRSATAPAAPLGRMVVTGSAFRFWLGRWGYVAAALVTLIVLAWAMVWPVRAANGSEPKADTEMVPRA